MTIPFSEVVGSVPQNVDSRRRDLSGIVWRHGQEGRHAKESIYGSADRWDLEGSGRRTAGRGIAPQAWISSATYYAWKAKYGGLSASELKRLKELEAENTRLKRLMRIWRSRIGR